MSETGTLLRPLIPSYEAALANLRERLIEATRRPGAIDYAILRITSNGTAYLAGVAGHRDEVARDLRAIARQGDAFELLECSGNLQASDFTPRG